MVQEVRMYKAKNGALFCTREEAEQEDRNVELKSFLENILEPHIIYGKMEHEDAINELVAHADDLRSILTGIQVEEMDEDEDDGTTLEENPWTDEMKSHGICLDCRNYPCLCPPSSFDVCEDCRDVLCRCP